MGFRIQQNCPRCGAQLELEETDRLINCPYCKVSSIILSSGYFRYVMHHNAPGKEIIYAPYLRFKGAAYYCQWHQVINRAVDISSAATSLKPLYKSLGVRTQTVKASFLNPETEGLFLPIKADPDDIAARAAVLPDNNMLPKTKGSIWERELKDDFAVDIGAAIASIIWDSDIEFGSLGYQPQTSSVTPESEPEDEQTLCHEFIGETLSIVYLPLYFENGMLYDAVVNEPLGKIDEEDAALLQSAASKYDWQVNFLPLLCPQCGWELGGSRNSIAFTCPNCSTAWEIDGARLNSVPLRSVPGADDAAVHLPFWKITARCPGLGIQSYADLIHLEKPLMATEEYNGMHASFFIPAFVIAPKVFLTTAKRVTFTQHALPPEEKQVQVKSVCAITMPRDEAIQSIKLVLASGAYNKKQIASQLCDTHVHVMDSALVYLPFNDSGCELSAQYGIQVSIIKKSLEMASTEPQFGKEPEPKVILVTCPLCGKEVPGKYTNCPYCGAGL